MVEPPAVTVVPATKREFVDRLFVSGTLVAREEAQVAARIDGLAIVELDAEDGDHVREGQVLARLDRSQLDALLAQNDAATKRADAAIDQAQSLIAQSQAQAQFASADFDRARKLGQGVMAASTIEQRQTAMKTADAQLAAARFALGVAEADRKSRDAERQELEVRIDRTEVKAPVSGIVMRRSAKLGAAASTSGEPLFRIIEDGAIDLEADVPEQSLARLAVGMPAELKLPGVEGAVSGRVRLVNQEVDKASRTGKVRIALEDVSHAHVGAFASGLVERARREGVGVPATALERDGDEARLDVVSDGKVELRQVKAGIADGDWVEILAGVTERRKRGRARRRFLEARRPGAADARSDRGQRLREAGAMRLNVSAWSIRKPIPAIVGFAVLTILGLVSFRTMPITRFPNIDIPIVQVLITQSGAAPSELESQVTKKVEDAVASVNGVWHIASTVTDGSSSTIVQFTVGSVDIDRALNDVKDQIAKIRTDLPRTIDEPIISRVDIEGLPIVTYAASAPGLTAEQLSWFIDDKVARDLQSMHGVGEVKRFGGVDREIRVALDPEKLLALGVTAAAVNEQVRADNVDLGGGRGEIGGQEQAIRTLAGARKLDDLAALPIALPGGRRVRLDELATVTDGAAEPRTFTRLFDEPIVAFGVTRAKGASDVTVDGLIEKRLAKDRGRASGGEVHQGRHPGRQRGRQLSFDHGDADRGRGSGRRRGVHLPARLARHARHRDRAAALGHSDLLGDGRDRLLAQPREPARHHAGDRHSGRRRDRRDREHRPPHADGQIGLSRLARGGRRDRACGDRDLAVDRRDLLAGELHGRHRGAIFPPVRPDGGDRRHVLAARRALRHAGDRRLFPARARHDEATGTARSCASTRGSCALRCATAG